MRQGPLGLTIGLLLAGLLLAGCGEQAGPTATIEATRPATSQSTAVVPVATASPEIAATETPWPAVTSPIASEPPPTATAEATTVTPATVATAVTGVPQLTGCRIGTGLRKQTAPILVQNQEYPGLVMSAGYGQAGVYFPQLEGWIRVLGAPSLALLERQAQRAKEEGLAYEALGYGLETGESTPELEWQDLVGSTEEARAIADRYDKLLVMGPGFRLMSDNEDKYAAMAAESDIWVLQTQRLQVSPPGLAYREEVERVVELIRAGHPEIQIWAQITLAPDRPPDASEWLAYRESIEGLVEGTYLGIYTWNRMEESLLTETMEEIYARACGGGR